MVQRYEPVRSNDDDDVVSPVSPASPPTGRFPRQQHPIPNSPPPSFRSRTSSPPVGHRLPRQVDPALADAFDADSDDEDDDRQRLMRQTMMPARRPPSHNGGGASSTVSGENTPPSSSGGDVRSGGATTGPNAGGSSHQPGSGSGMRVFGGGMQSDGVFSNLAARPEAGDGEKEELPPTYEQAAADQAPPYWETTILAPGLGGPDDVYIDGMPVGSIFSFLWNAVISMSFQLVGFLLTYLLHSTHAAKNGSRAGLGVTLIQWGFYMKATPGMSQPGGGSGSDGGYADPPDPNSHDFDPNQVGTTNGGGGGGDSSLADLTGGDWAAYALMIIGWFIIIRAMADYQLARRHEQLVLQSPERGLGIPVIAVGERPDTVV